jgi:hypothetical protein
MGSSEAGAPNSDLVTSGWLLIKPAHYQGFQGDAPARSRTWIYRLGGPPAQPSKHPESPVFIGLLPSEPHPVCPPISPDSGGFGHKNGFVPKRSRGAKCPKGSRDSVVFLTLLKLRARLLRTPDAYTKIPPSLRPPVAIIKFLEQQDQELMRSAS